MLAEPFAGAPRGEVEFDHPRVQRRQRHPGAAGGIGRRFGVVPDGDAAADEVGGRRKIGRELRIKRPFLPAGQRVERDHPVARRADQEPAVGQDRRVLEAHALRAGARPLAGVESPGGRETGHVVRGDLGCVRKAPTSRVAAVGRPFLGGSDRRRQQRDRNHKTAQSCGEAWRHPGLTCAVLRSLRPIISRLAAAAVLPSHSGAAVSKAARTSAMPSERNTANLHCKGGPAEALCLISGL